MILFAKVNLSAVMANCYGEVQGNLREGPF